MPSTAFGAARWLLRLGFFMVMLSGWTLQDRSGRCRGPQGNSLETLRLGIARTLRSWALQGYSAVEHCQDILCASARGWSLCYCWDTLCLGTAGILYSTVQYCKGILRLGIAGETLRLGTGILCCWHCRHTPQLGNGWMICSWALHGGRGEHRLNNLTVREGEWLLRRL